MKQLRHLHLVLVLLAAALAAGCQGDMTVKNGPAGDQRMTWGPPWNTAPSSSRTSTRTTTPTPCGPVLEEREECEGGACGVTPPADR